MYMRTTSSLRLGFAFASPALALAGARTTTRTTARRALDNCLDQHAESAGSNKDGSAVTSCAST